MELRKSLAFFILHAWCQYKTIRGNGWHCFFGSLECSPTRLLLYLPHLLTFLLYIWSHWVVVVVGGGGNPPSAQPTLISIYLKPIFKWNLGRKNIHVEQVIVFAHQKLIFPQSPLLSNVSKHLLESLVTFCLPGSSGTTAVLTPCLEGQKVGNTYIQPAPLQYRRCRPDFLEAIRKRSHQLLAIVPDWNILILPRWKYVGAVAVGPPSSRVMTHDVIHPNLRHWREDFSFNFAIFRGQTL